MGGNVAVNYSTYGISEQDWKKLSPKTQEFVNSAPQAAKQIARLLEKGYDIKDINEYYDNLQVAGMSVEKGNENENVPPQDLTPEEIAAKEKEKLENLRQEALKTTPDMMDNKDMRKMNEEQWETYFLERYKQDPAEARRDIVQVMYQKEVSETKQTLQNMMRDTKAEKMLKSKYLAEGFATEEEKERYEARKAELRKLYMEEPRAKWDAQIKPLQEQFNALDANDPKRAELQKQIEELQAKREKACDKAALDAYNSIRPPHEKVQEKDWVQDGEHLSTEQIEAILDLKALDAFDITEGKIQEMAIRAVSESKFNKGVAEVQKLREEIEKLKTENITQEVQRVQNKAIMADRKYEEDIAKLLDEAETEESIKLRKEATEANIAARAEIARLRKAGNDVEADALEKKRLADKEEAQKKIQEALDQDKLAEANKLTEERNKAREAAKKEAYDALPEKVREKIAKLEKKIQKTMDEANTDNNKLLTENLDDIAKIMAKTQINKQRAENKFNKTVVKYDKLDDDIKKWIQDNPEDFAELAKEGETPPLGETFTTKRFVLDRQGNKVFDENGDPKMEEQRWVFKSQKFKEYMLAMSNDNNLDNDEAVDPYNKADFRADMQDRKKVTRAHKGEMAKTKFKDRRFAAKCFNAAGIEKEGDRTFGMQVGATVKAFGKGFVVGSIGALAAEYLSTTKVVESKFFKLVQYSGSVPWSKVVHYSKTVQGSSAYHDQVVAEGDITSYVEFDYEGDADWNYSGDHNYSGSGVAHGDYNGTASGTVPVTHKDYQNGILIGEYTQDVDVNLPYSGEIDIPYDYNGTIHVDANGTVHYTGTVGGNVTQHYRKVIDVNGEVHWEAVVEDDIEVSGEAEYSGEEKVEGTTKGSPKINLKNVLNIGIGAGIANVMASLPEIVKIKDEGMRKETIRRQVLSDKGVDERKSAPPTPPVPPTQSGNDDDDDGNCDDVTNNDCRANLAMEDGKPTPKEENVKYEPTYFRESRERSEWYDFAAAYDWDPKKVSLKQVYRAIQARNGYTNENPNPPKQMMLPLDLDLGNGVVLKRKDNYTIAKHKIPQNENGNNKGRAAGGKANIISIPGTPKYYFIDCNGKEHIVNSETEARTKYKEATGKDFEGPIPKK